MDRAIANTLGLSCKKKSLTAPTAAPATSPSPDSKPCLLMQQSSPAVEEHAGVEDHVFIGTRKGEVLVCDAARQGLLVLRVPAIK